MATPTFYSNWPTFNQRHHNAAAVPPPPELLPFHDNFTLSDNNNLQFHNPIIYPTLSSSYSPPPPLLPDLPLTFNHEYYSNSPIVPDACDNLEYIPMNPVQPMQPDYYHPYYYPVVNDVHSMEHVQMELPPLPETYDGGGVMLTSYGGGLGFDGGQGEEMKGKDGRVSAQSMAARVRRRKISEKTSELGKLVPGGHRMTTAEMFQAAFKYIKFLQAQVGVLQLMPSSPGLGSELQALLTCPMVQEKLYAAGKCIVSQELGETLADDHQETKN